MSAFGLVHDFENMGKKSSVRFHESSALAETGFGDLVDQARGGDRDSIERLAVLVRDTIYPYLYRATLNQNLSDDLLQETLLTMTLYLPSLEQSSSFWCWIRRIARSKIQDSFRRRRSEASAISGWYDRYKLSQMHERDNVLSVMIWRENRSDVAAALRGLKKQFREVLQLRCSEGMTYLKIAGMLHCSCRQARSNFNKAKEALKVNLPSVDWSED